MGSKPRRPAGPATITIEGQVFDKEELLQECEEALEKLLEEQAEDGSDFATYESKLLELVHEIARRKLEKKLQAVADGLEARLAIDHVNDWHGLREGTVFEYRRHCPGRVTYHSLVGPLAVRRHTYRERGWNGSTYVPLELSAGLMERMTPALAKSTAIAYAHMPPRTCEQLMVASGLRPPSRSTFDRAARDLGAYAVACNAEIEPLVRSNEVIDPKTAAIAVGLDRTAVPMRHGEKDEPVNTAYHPLRRSRPRPRKRAQIRGSVQWRMDYVGTVAFLDEDKNVLATRKYRLPGGAEVSMIVDRMTADVRHAVVQRPVPIVVVQDGAPELWNAVAEGLSREPLVNTWTEVLDWYHLDERLSKCLDLCTTPTTRESQRKRWHAQLLESDRGISRVIRSLRRSSRELDEAAAQELDHHINYLVRNKHRAAYASYRARSLPIGSGITEGACKSVVGVRAKRSGQRWSQRGLTAALHLRAIHDSDRFDGFWSFFTRRYRAWNVVPIGATAH